MLIDLLILVVVLGVLYVASSVKVVKQYERGVVFRFGRLQEQTRGPGITMIVPAVDRMRKVNLQIVTMPVPAQEGITRDNVTVRVDAVVYFNVTDPIRAVVNVEDYLFAMGQVAQTSLRSIIGKSDLDELLANREKLNQGLELMIDSPALGWGVHIDRVEIKDVSLPESMKRSIARQAEAERERRSRIISAQAGTLGFAIYTSFRSGWASSAFRTASAVFRSSRWVAFTMPLPAGIPRSSSRSRKPSTRALWALYTGSA